MFKNKLLLANIGLVFAACLQDIFYGNDTITLILGIVIFSIICYHIFTKEIN